MRRLSAAAFAVALLVSAEALASDTSPIESWTKAQQPPPAPIQTRHDTLLIERSKLNVSLAASLLTSQIVGEGSYFTGRFTEDSTVWTGDWRRYEVIPATGRGIEELFTAAIAPRDYQRGPFDRIDYRVVITIRRLPPKKRGGEDRSLVVASAQFIGCARASDGLGSMPPEEIESSGLIERDFFERLQARLSGH